MRGLQQDVYKILQEVSSVSHNLLFSRSLLHIFLYTHPLHNVYVNFVSANRYFAHQCYILYTL